MKRSILTALALSGALVLGACGSATNDTATGGSTSQQQKATDVKVGDTVDLKTLAEKSAAAVKEKGTAHMTMSLGSDGTMDADIDYRGSAPKMSMSMTTAGESIQMVYVDKVMYMGGAAMAEAAGGKKWIRIDPQGDDMMSKMMGPLLGQMESAMSNPTEQLKDIEGAKATVAKVENGVTTYSVKLSKEQLTAMAKKQAAGIPGVTEEALKQMPNGVTYDLSMDASHLPAGASVDVGGQKMTMTYSKWGEPVTVKAPPASEVGTFEMPTS